MRSTHTHTVPAAELPRWYVYADRLTPTSRPFYLGIGMDRDKVNYSERPEAWHRYVRKHTPQNGVKTALEARRMTRRQANRMLRQMVERWKPEIEPEGDA